MEDYIWEVEVLSDFCTACLSEYWQSEFTLHARLEETSPLNLSNLREKVTKR